MEKFLIMIKQEILDTFILENQDGRFSVINPSDFDKLIGYFNTKHEAESAFKTFVNDNQITFTDGSEH